MGLSVVIALGTVWLAIALSYATNWPIGFFVGALGALFYGIGRAFAVWQHGRVVHKNAAQVVALI
jgi:zinc/manganese transport system permease protein